VDRPRLRLRGPQEGKEVLPGEEAGPGPGEDPFLPKPPVEGGPRGKGLEDGKNKGARGPRPLV